MRTSKEASTLDLLSFSPETYKDAVVPRLTKQQPSLSRRGSLLLPSVSLIQQCTKKTGGGLLPLHVQVLARL